MGRAGGEEKPEKVRQRMTVPQLEGETERLTQESGQWGEGKSQRRRGKQARRGIAGQRV